MASSTDPPHSAAASSSPDWYVIVSNVSKKANIGNMIRSACAFGVTEVLIVGNKKNVQYFGAQGTHKHVKMVCFDKLGQAVAYVKERGCHIVGIEIIDGAASVASHPFRGPTAFILGNEGHGLRQVEIDVCDHFVYIPQFGDGTASLNVTVAASIVFHHFAEWAGYAERARQGYKYVVAEIPVHASGAASVDEFMLSINRKKRKLERIDAIASGDAGKRSASDAALLGNRATVQAALAAAEARLAAFQQGETKGGGGEGTGEGGVGEGGAGEGGAGGASEGGDGGGGASGGSSS